jgi:SAM-dependent methyltransferase
MAVLGFLRRGDKEGEAPAGHSFGEKLHAWWEGYELPAKDAAPEPAAADASPAPAAEAPPPLDAWSKSRIKVAELIWGDGFNFPGSADHVVELVKPFGLNKEKSLLDLGCGLGGGTRAIAKEFGAYVEGMEHSPGLAKAGMEMSEKAGLAKKASIVAYDPMKVYFTPRRYDAVFARMVLWNLPDKKRLLGEIDKGLKPKGQLTFTDYTLKADAAGEPAVQAWLKAEHSTVAPCTLEDFTAILGELKIEIRIAEDMTHDFRRLVTEGWAKLVKLLGGGSTLAPEEAQALVREAELWRTRIALLDSGSLQIARFFGIKR